MQMQVHNLSFARAASPDRAWKNEYNAERANLGAPDSGAERRRVEAKAGSPKYIYRGAGPGGQDANPPSDNVPAEYTALLLAGRLSSACTDDFSRGPMKFSDPR